MRDEFATFSTSQRIEYFSIWWWNFRRLYLLL